MATTEADFSRSPSVRLQKAWGKRNVDQSARKYRDQDPKAFGSLAPAKKTLMQLNQARVKTVVGTTKMGSEVLCEFLRTIENKGRRTTWTRAQLGGLGGCEKDLAGDICAQLVAKDYAKVVVKAGPGGPGVDPTPNRYMFTPAFFSDTRFSVTDYQEERDYLESSSFPEQYPSAVPQAEKSIRRPTSPQSKYRRGAIPAKEGGKFPRPKREELSPEVEVLVQLANTLPGKTHIEAAPVNFILRKSGMTVAQAEEMRIAVETVTPHRKAGTDGRLLFLGAIRNPEIAQSVLDQAAKIQAVAEAAAKPAEAPTSKQAPIVELLASRGINHPQAVIQSLPPENRTEDFVLTSVRIADYGLKTRDARGFRQGGYLIVILKDEARRKAMEDRRNEHEAMLDRAGRTTTRQIVTTTEVPLLAKLPLEGYQKLLNTTPSPESAGYLAHHDAEREARQVLIRLAYTGLSRAWQMVLRFRLVKHLEAAEMKHGSLVWNRAFRHHFPRLVAAITPWFSEVIGEGCGTAPRMIRPIHKPLFGRGIVSTRRCKMSERVA